jgi:hypothetical protein
MKKLILILFLIFAFAQWGEAATRYINSDSDGSALNPTRPFDNASYVANDSYKLISAAITAASAGDVLEISGGTSGKSYAGPSGLIATQLTFKGSQISGHNATVTMTWGGISVYVFRPNTDGVIAQDLTISGSDLYYPVYITSTNSVFTRVKITHAGAAKSFIYAEKGATFTDVVIDGDTGPSSTGLEAATNAGTFNFTRCWIKYTTLASTTAAIYGAQVAGGNTVNFNYSILEGTLRTLWSYSTGVINLNNCIVKNITNGIVAYPGVNSTINAYNTSFLSSRYGFNFNSGAINTTNCFIQGVFELPNTYRFGTGTWTSTGDILNSFPYLTKTKENIGYYSLCVDIQGGGTQVAAFKELADYAMNTCQIPMTGFVGYTNLLSSGDKTNLQTLYKAGHDIGVKNRHDSSMLSLNAFSVTYSGANVDMAFVVSEDGTTLNVTGTSDTHLGIDLEAAAYDTLGELCAVIEAWDNFTCSLTTSVSGYVKSTTLKDVSTALPQTVATGIPFDDTTAATNRYYVQEILGGISDLEAALHEDAGCAAYLTKTMAFPYSGSTTQILTWIAANTTLNGVRRSDAGGGSEAYYASGWLGNMNTLSISDVRSTAQIEGADYAGLTEAQKKVRLEQAARVIATYISMGFYHSFEIHPGEVTLQEFGWFLDELVKYRSPYNIKISSYQNIINEIKASPWTDAGSGIWTRTFTETDDYHLLSWSPLVDTGKDVTLYRDYDQNSVPSGYGTDIGAYELPQFTRRYYYGGGVRYGN